MYQRVGYLFQGNYKTKLINDNSILLHVSRYIHLNPVEADLVKCAEDWEYSSYRDYIGLRAGSLPQPGIILDQLGNVAAYQDFVESHHQDEKEKIAMFNAEDSSI